MFKRHKIYKNFKLFTICSAIFSWFLLTYLLFFVNPKELTKFFYAPFFILLFLVIFLTLKIFIKKYTIPAFSAFGINLFLILRLLNFKQWFIPIIILGLILSLIYFFTLSEENDKLTESNLNNQSEEKN
ncbi:hypothetical protein GYA19_02315 [Candidatus Beckwithbacteria bacterium]|nr:hypothetical protein [Candidatus Beckwithbacteria bacterium]